MNWGRQKHRSHVSHRGPPEDGEGRSGGHPFPMWKPPGQPGPVWLRGLLLGCLHQSVHRAGPAVACPGSPLVLAVQPLFLTRALLPGSAGGSLRPPPGVGVVTVGRGRPPELLPPRPRPGPGPWPGLVPGPARCPGCCEPCSADTRGLQGSRPYGSCPGNCCPPRALCPHSARFVPDTQFGFPKLGHVV